MRNLQSRSIIMPSSWQRIMCLSERVVSRFVVAGVCLVILLPLSAFAQSSGQSASGGSPKRTTLNFEDQLVEGQTQKPELFYLLQQRNNNFKRLIILRENFLPEMRKTSEEIGRKGSAN